MSTSAFEAPQNFMAPEESPTLDDPIVVYDAAPGHRWYNHPNGFGPKMTSEEIERFIGDPSSLIPDFEALSYPEMGDDPKSYKKGRVPVVSGEGYQEIAIHVFRYSKVTRAIHRAIHRFHASHIPVAGSINSDFGSA